MYPQPRPDEVAEQRQRLHRTLRRITELPVTLRHVVELRVLQGRSTEDECRTLDHAGPRWTTLAINEQNLFVRLHRARRVLAS